MWNGLQDFVSDIVRAFVPPVSPEVVKNGGGSQEQVNLAYRRQEYDMFGILGGGLIDIGALASVLTYSARVDKACGE